MKKHNVTFLCQFFNLLSGVYITDYSECVLLIFMVVIQVNILNPQKKDVYLLGVLSRSLNAVSLSGVTGLSQQTSPSARSVPAFVHWSKGRVSVLTEVVIKWEGQTVNEHPKKQVRKRNMLRLDGASLFLNLNVIFQL